MEFFESISKCICEIWLIIGLEETIMVLDVCLKFGVMYDLGSQDTGSNGVQNGVFQSISKSICEIWLIIGPEETFMVLDVCVKFRVMYDLGSLDMGSNGVQNGIFRKFLKKYLLNLADFRAGRNCYGT